MGRILQERLRQTGFRSEEHEALLNLFVASNFLRQRLDAACLAYDITGPQYNVLRILKGAHPKGHPRCEIISRMLEPAPDVTRLIDRLVAKGMVQRKVSHQDARLSVATITPRGMIALAHLQPEIDVIEEYVASRLTKTECRTFSQLCEQLYGDQSSKTTNSHFQISGGS